MEIMDTFKIQSTSDYKRDFLTYVQRIRDVYGHISHFYSFSHRKLERRISIFPSLSAITFFVLFITSNTFHNSAFSRFLSYLLSSLISPISSISSISSLLSSLLSFIPSLQRPQSSSRMYE